MPLHHLWEILKLCIHAGTVPSAIYPLPCLARSLPGYGPHSFCPCLFLRPESFVGPFGALSPEHLSPAQS